MLYQSLICPAPATRPIHYSSLASFFSFFFFAFLFLILVFFSLFFGVSLSFPLRTGQAVIISGSIRKKRICFFSFFFWLFFWVFFGLVKGTPKNKTKTVQSHLKIGGKWAAHFFILPLSIGE